MSESRVEAVAKALFITEMTETARSKEIELHPKAAEVLWLTAAGDSQMMVWCRLMARTAIAALAAYDRERAS